MGLDSIRKQAELVKEAAKRFEGLKVLRIFSLSSYFALPWLSLMTDYNLKDGTNPFLPKLFLLSFFMMLFSATGKESENSLP